MTILFASSNTGKIREVRSLAHAGWPKIIGADELKLSDPAPSVVESGATYIENARLKADAFCRWSGYPTIADDTGLEVEALHGDPGVLSARYAGEGASAEQNRNRLLQMLHGEERRQACFRCVLVYLSPSGLSLQAEGTLNGEILHEPRGTQGFGYDSVFFVPAIGKTLAEAKEGVLVDTHRKRALELLFAKILSI